MTATDRAGRRFLRSLIANTASGVAAYFIAQAKNDPRFLLAALVISPALQALGKFLRDETYLDLGI